MSSKHDDNFDLYDDPYADTGANADSDPYADDDDSYYNTSSSHGHRASDHPRNRDASVHQDYDDYSSNRGNTNNDNNSSISKSSYRDDEDNSKNNNNNSSGHSGRYSGDGGRDDDYRGSHDDSYKREPSNSAYDPQSSYDDYSSSNQDPQRTSQQGGGYGSNADRDLYDQQDQGRSFSQQQQQQQQQSSAASASRELGKMFIGGLNWETTDESLSKYFSRYGELSDCMVMKDPVTNKSRGFGFLTFADHKNVDAVLKEDHHLDGKMIDPKRAIPREEQEKTEKIFVGGIPPDVTEEEFSDYFSQFGHVLDATLMLDRNTGRPRGFGFITFESDRGVDAALSRRDLMLKDKVIEVKRAQPKNRADTRGGHSTQGFGQQAHGGFGAAQGVGRGYGGMNPSMMAAGYAGFNMEAYAQMLATTARFDPNAAIMLQRLRMAGMFANQMGGAAGFGGAGMMAGGAQDAAAAYHRQNFNYNNQGNNANVGAGGATGGDGATGGSQGRPSGYGSGSGPTGGNSHNNSGNSYNSKYDDHQDSGSSGQRRYGSQSGSHGQDGGYQGGNSGSGGYNSSSSRGSNSNTRDSGSSGGRQGGSGSSGPVRGSNSQSSSGRGSSYHPYQR
ncbi:hypothetical protein BGZ83_006310 [Gryganskiella cystojenkinii]|nr:hypothetical protein BGZ83_006310 [Gryganskiella cystojenkinii]